MASTHSAELAALRIDQSPPMAGEPSPPAPVERFGRYRLLRVVGQGGMAEVWEARLEGSARPIALKRILPRLVNDSATVDMFLWESALVARLKHPNIVQTYEVGHVGRQPYIAMELLEGLTMASLLRATRTPPPVPFAVYVVRELARALAYLHQLTDGRGWPLGLVHRDVSLSNVVITRDGAVKLLDFGVAKSFKGLAREITPHGVLKGKFAYMAPERFGKDGYDGRVDVFAAGVILHELMTHRRLFKGRDDFHTVALVEGATVPAPSTLNRDVPPEVDRIALRALARDPAQRYAGADELAHDLDRALDRYSWRIADAAALVCATAGHAPGLGGERTPASLSGAPTALRVEMPTPAPVEAAAVTLELDRLPPPAHVTQTLPLALESEPTLADSRVVHFAPTGPPPWRAGTVWLGAMAALVAAAVLTTSAGRHGRGAPVTPLAVSPEPALPAAQRTAARPDEATAPPTGGSASALPAALIAGPAGAPAAAAQEPVTPAAGEAASAPAAAARSQSADILPTPSPAATHTAGRTGLSPAADGARALPAGEQLRAAPDGAAASPAGERVLHSQSADKTGRAAGRAPTSGAAADVAAADDDSRADDGTRAARPSRSSAARGSATHHDRDSAPIDGVGLFNPYRTP